MELKNVSTLEKDVTGDDERKRLDLCATANREAYQEDANIHERND